ncbi:Protein CBG26074 [Caenorhabditis briggsae]|uniref:Protein CBG26074 n=1 Tax=Caenorhabditis briggsae TaxID=6238 RepID=B6ILQ7_CAEBR|nr:Protein CBG26074 [Caenorhabditis briggsae]CAS00837.1 Protein CBG26074 [Caenorhabditis briggsae]
MFSNFTQFDRFRWKFGRVDRQKINSSRKIRVAPQHRHDGKGKDQGVKTEKPQKAGGSTKTWNVASSKLIVWREEDSWRRR